MNQPPFSRAPERSCAAEPQLTEPPLADSALPFFLFFLPFFLSALAEGL